ncbi:hypothetical protein H696_01835 [Fonticula alba]|uniref:YEATS domain-containing protein n=1 Tax=Fonticula alba TaxID=691883 RepID=A0A058ZAA2_FONAL|nr:hypothetical protein H696_01835 [Fonticula alba]KCV70888.1 hypothetical protein H696_01835 [Fonticula alba]|eukprot:XP_009494011.1 hypothetical protein H696_01835 [Fonticula alba]
MSNRRQKGVILERGIVYGNSATLLARPTDNGHTHKWTVYVRGLYGEDISYFVRKISFKLHESFSPQTRVVDTHPFELTETGWGEFEIQIRLFFHDPHEKPVVLLHPLRLYPVEGITTERDAGKLVVAERYDEVIFNEPTHVMANQLELGPPAGYDATPTDSSKYISEVETIELRQIAEAEAAVCKQIEAAQQKLAQLDQGLLVLNREVAEMEAERAR